MPFPPKGNTIWYVLFYGVVSVQTEKVVEFFIEREAAEAMIREVREDEPLLARIFGWRRSSLGCGPSKGFRSSGRSGRELDLRGAGV